MHDDENIQAEVFRRINITDYLWQFLFELSEREKEPVKISKEFEAERIKGLLNVPKNTAFKSQTDMRTGHAYWSDQKVDYIASNLKNRKGYIFYFICERCGDRVKYLYEYSAVRPPLCRLCCRVKYKRKKRLRARTDWS